MVWTVFSRKKKERGFPEFGPCAGAIVLARKILGNKFSDNNGLNALNITVHRNAYGSQTESFETKLHVKGFHNRIPAVFIRAPMMEVNDSVEVLSELDMHPVLVQQKNMLAATFHPELTKDTRIHRYFVEMVKKNVSH